VVAQTSGDNRVMITPLAKVLVVVAIAIVVFDALASIASVRLRFPYPRAVIGSWIIYATVGFCASAGGGGVLAGAMSGIAMGIVDATAGWAVSAMIGPGRIPGGLSFRRWAGVTLTVAAAAGCVGVIGALLAAYRAH